MGRIRSISTIILALLFLFGTQKISRAGGTEALSFGEDGTFTVMIVSDAQDLPAVSSYYSAAMNGALDDYEPDLVVFLGDQLDGANAAYGLGNRAENVKKGIGGVLAPVVSHGVPFTLVLGTADMDAGVPAEDQLDLYRAYPGCLVPEADESGVRRLGVKPYAGGAEQLSFFFFDTLTRTPDGGEGAVSPEQIEWYRQESQKLREKNGGDVVPAVGFAHGIVPEIYEAFEEAAGPSGNTFAGSGDYEDTDYEKDSKGILLGGVNEAPVPSSENNGLFDAFCEEGDIFAAFFGGDHKNTFLTTLEGVDLVAMPGATYTGENLRFTRGVRLVRFYEDNVRDYEIRFVPFSDYEDVRGLRAIPYYLSTTTQISNGVKIAFLSGVLALAVALLFILDGRRKGEIPPPYDDGKEDIPLGTEADAQRTGLTFRELHGDETEDALALAYKVFLDFEAADYGQEGVAEFDKSIHDPAYVAKLKFYGAFDGKTLIGVLAARENGAHIALFFVERAYQKQGVGKALFALMCKTCPQSEITVNSSPFAVPVYEKLGFSATAEEQIENGVRFTPMVWKAGE